VPHKQILITDLKTFEPAILAATAPEMPKKIISKKY
jgi:hypothetical protein